MKKICLINFGNVIDSTGGTEKILVEMGNEFSRRGYKVSILCSEKKKGGPFWSLRDEITFINFGHNIKSGFWKRVIRKVLGILKIDYGYIANKTQIDEALKNFLINNPQDLIISFFPMDLFYIMKNKTKEPVIQMLHGSSKWLFKNFYDTTKLRILNQVDVLQVLLPSYKDALNGVFHNKIVVIPNVVPQYNGVTNYNKKVVYLTRYDIDKQIENLIKAFYYASKGREEWQLHIYGTEWTAGYKKSLCNLVESFGIKNKVFLHGRIFDIESVLFDAAICGFPSAHEGFGLALTEAMSAGLPCIGYQSCTGVNELIIDGYNGFLVEDGIKDFSDKLRLLMSDMELIRLLGRNAKESIHKYKIEKVYEKWELLIKEIDSIKR